MARYAPVLRIVIAHEYLAGAPLRPRLVADAVSAERMVRADMLLRPSVDGGELWGADMAAARAAFPLVFAVYCDDPQLRFCTDWPVAPPLRYIADGSGGAPRAETLAGSGATRAPLLSLEIDALPAPDGEGPALCQLNLAARKMHWKYFFSGSLATRKLSIVDLDGDDAKGIAALRFVPSALTATADGAAWTSELALPMQKIPQQRLQLREEGGAGRVLIRRLPNASVAQLGKERGRDGAAMIVAEIYIHQ